MEVALKDAGVVGGDPSAEPIELEVKGLDAMNSDFSAVDVLFLKVREVGSRDRWSKRCAKQPVDTLPTPGFISPKGREQAGEAPRDDDERGCETRVGEQEGVTRVGDKFDARRVMRVARRTSTAGLSPSRAVQMSKRGEYDVDARAGSDRRVTEVRLVRE